MARTQQALTVEQLALHLIQHVKLGNGNKKILLSGDDEGNSYHYLFFGLTPAKEFEFTHPAMSCTLPFGLAPNEAERDYMVLG